MVKKIGFNFSNGGYYVFVDKWVEKIKVFL